MAKDKEKSKKPKDKDSKGSKSRRELIEERSKKLKQKGGGSYRYFIFTEGTQRMRMPRIPGDQEFCVEVVFFYLNKELGGVISAETFGEPCPFMEKYNKLKTSKKEGDKELLSRLHPSKKYMGPFFKYTDEKGKQIDTEKGVKLALLVPSQYQALCDFYLDEDKGDFSDPDTGYDLKFKREGKGKLDTEYTVLDAKPSPLPKQFRKEVFDPEQMVRDLIYPYDEAKELLEKFLGDDTPDEKPKMSKEGLKKKKKKSKDLN